MYLTIQCYSKNIRKPMQVLLRKMFTMKCYKRKTYRKLSRLHTLTMICVQCHLLALILKHSTITTTLTRIHVYLLKYHVPNHSVLQAETYGKPIRVLLRMMFTMQCYKRKTYGKTVQATFTYSTMYM